MQVSATAKRFSISPQKARLVVDQVRGKPVSAALDILNFSNQQGVGVCAKSAGVGDCQCREQRRCGH